MAIVNSYVWLGCKGVTLYVDTEAEAEAEDNDYGKGYTQRVKAVAAREAAQVRATANPCDVWTEPVPELSAQY